MNDISKVLRVEMLRSEKNYHTCRSDLVHLVTETEI